MLLTDLLNNMTQAEYSVTQHTRGRAGWRLPVYTTQYKLAACTLLKMVPCTASADGHVGTWVFNHLCCPVPTTYSDSKNV